MFKILFVMAFMLVGDANSYDEIQGAGDDDIHSIFNHIREIKIDGTEEFPLFRVSSLDVRDDMIAILDGTIPRVTLYDATGNPTFATGRRGSGPGDLLNPRWIGFTGSDQIAVLEGTGNNRIQFFSAHDGESEDILSGNFLFPGRHAFTDSTETPPRLWITVRASCPQDEGSQCVIQQVDLATGEVERHFGSTEEISPGAIGVPWILGRGDAGELYAAHTTAGGYIAVYDNDGTLLRRFAMDEASTMNVLEWDELPASTEEYFGLLQDGLLRSSIWALHVIGDDILVEHEARGGGEPWTRYISVFGTEGVYKTSVAVDFRGYAVQGDRIFFVEETDPEAEYGAFSIHEYRYTGVAE